MSVVSRAVSVATMYALLWLLRLLPSILYSDLSGKPTLAASCSIASRNSPAGNASTLLNSGCITVGYTIIATI